MAQVGIGIPNMPGVTPATIPDYARRIEAGGFHAIWTLDRVVYDLPHAIPTLAACAVVTERVRIGTAILLLPLYQPAVLAKQLATIDLLSNGRLTVGVGYGRRPDDFAAVGVPMKGRGGRAVEAVQIMRQAWSGEAVRFEGRHFAIDVGPIGPRPVQRPSIPIWMGGGHENAVRRAGRHADGFVAGGALGPENFATLRQRVTQALQDAGRSAAGFPFGCLAYFNVQDDRERAREELMGSLTRYYGPQFANTFNPEKMAVFGPPDECARNAQAYIDAGVEHLVLCPTTVDPRQVDRLARDVLPRLRLG